MSRICENYIDLLTKSSEERIRLSNYKYLITKCIDPNAFKSPRNLKQQGEYSELNIVG